MSLEFKRIEDPALWQKLLERSPQGTCFLETGFLDLFDSPYRLYGVFRGGVCIMGVPVIYAAPLPWCYQQGPVFYDEVFKGGQAKSIQAEVELAEFAIEELAKHERRFRFSLSPTLTDVRGYDWVHYHDPDKPRCTLLPRYTATVSLEGATRETMRLGARSARRQEERYSTEREKLSAVEDGSVTELFALYAATFEKQDIAVPAEEKRLFNSYVAYFLESGRGHILVVRDDNGQALAAAFVFKDIDQVWHVPIIGVGQTRYGGTMLYFKILDFALDRGGLSVDFDGANSPKRGYFKHSVGASARLYFEVRYHDE
ncbi:MAG: GNAT family N-acetyltransferase [Pseudomonadota bacterium]